MKSPKQASNAPTPSDCGGSPDPIDAQAPSDVMPHEADVMPSPDLDAPHEDDMMLPVDDVKDSQADATPPPVFKHNADDRPKRKRVFAAVRIVDFCLKALAPTDLDDPEGEQDWADISGATTLSTDREAIYQLARQNDGLLMSTSGLPGGKAMLALQLRAKALAEGTSLPF